MVYFQNIKKPDIALITKNNVLGINFQDTDISFDHQVIAILDFDFQVVTILGINQ